MRPPYRQFCIGSPRVGAVSISDREQLPSSGHALEFVFAPIVEVDTRTDDEQGHGTGHEHLSRASLAENPGGDVYADASDVIVQQLNFAGVQPGASLNAKRPHRFAQLERATDGASRPVEDGEDPVSGHLYQTPSVLFDHAPGHRFVAAQYVLPATIPRRRGMPG